MLWRSRCKGSLQRWMKFLLTAIDNAMWKVVCIASEGHGRGRRYLIKFWESQTSTVQYHATIFWIGDTVLYCCKTYVKYSYDLLQNEQSHILQISICLDDNTRWSGQLRTWQMPNGYTDERIKPANLVMIKGWRDRALGAIDTRRSGTAGIRWRPEDTPHNQEKDTHR